MHFLPCKNLELPVFVHNYFPNRPVIEFDWWVFKRALNLYSERINKGNDIVNAASNDWLVQEKKLNWTDINSDIKLRYYSHGKVDTAHYLSKITLL